MEKGFVLIALDNKINYTKLAYACALSIKHSQPTTCNHVTVITNNINAFDQYPVKAVDNVVLYDGPDGMDSRSRVYDFTPYEHTIFLDADMLVLESLEDQWLRLSNHYLYVASQIVNFKNEIVSGYGPYREVFEQYELPNLYNAFTYFKKSDPRTKDFFDLVKIITDNPRECISKFLPGSILMTLPTDEAFALVSKILDIDDEITDDVVKITHMKPLLQGWTHTNRWASQVRLSVSPQGLTKIGVWAQTGLLHYVDKTAINNLVLSTLEELACQKI
jgi:hypothetical protein